MEDPGFIWGMAACKQATVRLTFMTAPNMSLKMVMLIMFLFCFYATTMKVIVAAVEVVAAGVAVIVMIKLSHLAQNKSYSPVTYHN
jgi:hypothetical protein